MRLTRLELRLLQILLANAGHTLPAERLLAHVWGSRGSGDRQLLKQLVHRLRQKIEADGDRAALPGDGQRRGVRVAAGGGGVGGAIGGRLPSPGINARATLETKSRLKPAQNVARRD